MQPATITLRAPHGGILTTAGGVDKTTGRVLLADPDSVERFMGTLEGLTIDFVQCRSDVRSVPYPKPKIIAMEVKWAVEAMQRAAEIGRKL